jgi:hypothetical protein
MGRQMDPFLDPDFLHRHWDEIRDAPWWLILPLFALAAFVGWKLKDKLDDSEIRGVKAERDVYKAHLDLVKEKSGDDAKELTALRHDLKEIYRFTGNESARAFTQDAERRAITLASSNNEVREIASRPITGFVAGQSFGGHDFVTPDEAQPVKFPKK